MKIIKKITDKDLGLDTPIANLYTERRAVRGIVFDSKQNLVLLHSKKIGYHKIPGGGIEEGEEVIDALRREITEEVGCVVKNISELGIVEEYWDKLSIHQMSYCFISEIDGEKGIPQFEKHELEDDFEILWLSVDIAIKILEEEIMKLEDYRGRHINSRDFFCLKEVKEII